MKMLLDGILPRIFPGWVDREHFQCVPHEGKSDLDRSIPRKLANWRIPGDRFVIVRDNDNADCLAVKARLVAQCVNAGRPDSLVRLVCQELEGWYLGDLRAMEVGLESPGLDTVRHRKRFSDPDSWQKPSVEVKRLVPSFQKGGGARAMAEHLSPDGNTSRSFNVFVAGLRALAHEMGYVVPEMAA
ncbi:DUF4276 family protein [Luteibacter pinisoli]|nr:DUF4276 family protein [Luteibacter pinisoli]